MNYKVYGDELYHHGILGQKWGVRRFQNPDGSLKPAGEKRYYGVTTSGPYHQNKEISERMLKKTGTHKDGYHASKQPGQVKYANNSKNSNESTSEKKGLTDKQKKALKVGATVIGTAAVAAGTVYLAKKMDAKITREIQIKNIEAAHKWFDEAYKERQRGTVFAEEAEALKLNRRNAKNDIQKEALNGLYKESMSRVRDSAAKMNAASAKAMDHLNKSKQTNYSVGEKASYVVGRANDRLKEEANTYKKYAKVVKDTANDLRELKKKYK